jgi:hypothetical protein
VYRFVDPSPDRFVDTLTTVEPGNHPPNASIDSHLVDSISSRVLALRGVPTFLRLLAVLYGRQASCDNVSPVYLEKYTLLRVLAPHHVPFPSWSIW